ncbi:MAG: trigger factor [Cryomorphaceae bacterium]|nr:MAG: trigger factor [Cryomorphaceae bacterium]
MKIIEKKSKSSTSIIDLIIEKKDYLEKVDISLKDYRKKANIPGFRKGNVPVGLIKKQYGTAIKVEEVNRIVQKEISKYISDNNISILGSPLPFEDGEIDWTKDEINLKFEIAYKPNFKLNYKPKKTLTYFTVEADNEMINNQVESIQNQYGKLISLQSPEKESTISGNVKTAESKKQKNLSLDTQKFKKAFFSKYLSSAKVGSLININTKSFNEDKYLSSLFNIEEKDFINKDLIFQINEITKREKAILDKELYKKVYKNDEIKNQKQFKNKVKSDIEKQFINQSDQKFFNDCVEFLISNTKIDLPEKFIKKLIIANQKEKISENEIDKDFSQSLRGIKYQLIESKLIEENEIDINPDAVKSYAKEMVIKQMAMYGQNQPDDEQLNSIVQRVMSNEDELKRMYSMLINEKILYVFKNKISKKDSKVDYKKFIETAYDKND